MKTTPKTVSLRAVFIGPEKTATTWIDNLLRSDPRCCLPRFKEIRFLNFEFDRGIDWYLSQFGSQTTANMIEVAASYLRSPLAAERFVGVHGLDTPVIVMIRDPADRMFSAYFQQHKKGELSAPLMTELQSPDLIKRYGYAEALSRWCDLGLPIRFLFYDQLKKDPVLFTRNLYRAIELQPPSADSLADNFDLTARYYERSVARFPAVERFVRNVAYRLQVGRLQPLLQQARESKLRRGMFVAAPPVNETTRLFAAERFAQETEQVRRLVEDLGGSWSGMETR